MTLPPVCHPRVRSDARQSILDAALACFSNFGYEATSIRDISRAAGRSSAMIAYYFTSKEGLYREVVRSACESTALKFDQFEYSSNNNHDIEYLQEMIVNIIYCFDLIYHENPTKRDQLVGIYIKEILDPIPGRIEILSHCLLHITNVIRTCIHGIHPGLEPAQVDYWSSVVLGVCLSQATLIKFNQIIWNRHDFVEHRRSDIEKLALFVSIGLREFPMHGALPQS